MKGKSLAAVLVVLLGACTASGSESFHPTVKIALEGPITGEQRRRAWTC